MLYKWEEKFYFFPYSAALPTYNNSRINIRSSAYETLRPYYYSSLKYNKKREFNSLLVLMIRLQRRSTKSGVAIPLPAAFPAAGAARSRRTIRLERFTFLFNHPGNFKAHPLLPFRSMSVTGYSLLQYRRIQQLTLLTICLDVVHLKRDIQQSNYL